MSFSRKEPHHKTVLPQPIHFSPDYGTFSRPARDAAIAQQVAFSSQHSPTPSRGILRDLTERKKADSQIAKGDAIVREVLMKSELLTKISNMFGEKESVAAVAEEFKLKIADVTSEMEKQFALIQRRLSENEGRLRRQESSLKAVDQSVRRWVGFKQETYSKLVSVLDSAFQGIHLSQFPQASAAED
jgi:hypothetical protein